MHSQVIQIAIEFTFAANFQLFCTFIKFEADTFNLLISVLSLKILNFFLKWPKISGKLAFTVVVVFLAKILISKINDAKQAIIGLNGSFRPKGLSKTMGFAKSPLLTLKSKC